MNQHISDLKQWCEQELSRKIELSLLHADASPRVYYRATHVNDTWVAMDSSNEKQSIAPFISIAQNWISSGVNVPKILFCDMDKGWLILTDFGDKLLQYELSNENVDSYYQKCMDIILNIQRVDGNYDLPVFGVTHIQKELSLFKEWFVEKLLGMSFAGSWEKIFTPIEAKIISIFKQQPQVTVHRDFHSRNIMQLENDGLGIIDFQDAMIGPITYDLISLIKDCYICWDKNKVSSWQEYFYFKISENYKLINQAQFYEWCDWTSLQRHLKVLGIFSRLKLRDNKPRYLDDMPRIMDYVLEVTNKYPELKEFNDKLKNIVAPKLKKILEEHQAASAA
jgi:aminoglycoside/choline kinase family phosphotransferase